MRIWRSVVNFCRPSLCTAGGRTLAQPEKQAHSPGLGGPDIYISRNNRVRTSLLSGLATATLGALVPLVSTKYSIAVQLFKPLLRALRNHTHLAWCAASNFLGGLLLGSFLTYIILGLERPKAAPKLSPDLDLRQLSGGQEGELEIPERSLAILTQRGRDRACSEDAALAALKKSSSEALLLLADGQHGFQASALALQAVAAAYGTADFNLTRAFINADLAIKASKACRQIFDGEARSGLLAAQIEPGRSAARLLNFGDSRACLFRDGRLIILTRDNTLAAALEYRELKFPLEQEVGAYYEKLRTHQHRDILTGVLGEEQLEIGEADLPVSEIRLLNNDLLIMASAGLHNNLPFAQFQALLQSSQDAAPIELARRLQEPVKGEARDLALLIYRHGTKILYN